MSVKSGTGRWVLLLSASLLASCGPKTPDADDWRPGADAKGIVVAATLPAGFADDPIGPVTGRPVYQITEQALYFPLAVELQQRVYRYDIRTREGRWQADMPEESTARRPALQTGRLFASSDMLRQRERPPEPEAQPFGRAKIRLEQHESTYSHTYYRIGFPFGSSGWVTHDYGDGTVALYSGTDASDMTLLLSQSYRADNYPFTAGWSPDGRYVLVLEMLESASHYRERKGHTPSLRFAVFGPYPVEKTEAEILAFHARADEKKRQGQLDSRLRRGLIDPEERYGKFYEELLDTIRSCSALVAITGPIDDLTLAPDRTLGLSDGSGEDDGRYFTFDIQTARGSGTLRAAAFYPETPERVRREIISRIVRYDLSFNGRIYFLDDCDPT